VACLNGPRLLGLRHVRLFPNFSSFLIGGFHNLSV
jgi:hypothetical protein